MANVIRNSRKKKYIEKNSGNGELFSTCDHKRCHPELGSLKNRAAVDAPEGKKKKERKTYLTEEIRFITLPTR